MLKISNNGIDAIREVYQYHRQRAFEASRKLRVHKKAAEDLKKVLEELDEPDNPHT